MLIFQLENVQEIGEIEAPALIPLIMLSCTLTVVAFDMFAACVRQLLTFDPNAPSSPKVEFLTSRSCSGMTNAVFGGPLPANLKPTVPLMIWQLSTKMSC